MVTSRRVKGRSAEKSGAGAEAALYGNFSALDGLRGIAILWVVSFHLPSQLPPLGNPFTRRGPIGVELFFAISGFLVTRSLHQCIRRAGPASTPGHKLAILRDFAVRRVARIWPPYFLAFAVGVASLVVDPVLRARSADVWSILWSYPLFVANYLIPSHQPSLSLLVMWSLCFEEQFYLFLAIVYAIGGKHLGRWLALTAFASIALRLWAATAHPELFPSFLVMQMQPHWRFDALAWGCLGWLFHQRIADFWRTVRAPGLVALAVVVCAVLVCVPYPQAGLPQAWDYLALAPAFSVLVVTLALSPSFWLGRLLAWGPLAFVGVISYEMYLSHVAVYRLLARAHLDRWPFVYETLCIALSIGVAWAFHHAFSKPTQRAIRAWVDRRGGIARAPNV